MEIQVNDSYSLTYSIKKDGDKYYTIYDAGGKDYRFKSYMFCKNDTLYSFKNASPEFLTSGSDTTGVVYYSPCKIPLNLKVGDSLNSYMEMSTNQFKNATKGQASESWGYTYGNYRYTTSTLYESTVNSKFNTGTWTISFVNAAVVAHEKITVQGTEYLAYKISSETWTRTVTQVSSSSDSRVVDKKYKKVDKKINKKNEKLADKMADNEQGYMVAPMDQWFVPELGLFVKSVIYNSQKILTIGKVELKSLK